MSESAVADTAQDRTSQDATSQDARSRRALLGAGALGAALAAVASRTAAAAPPPTDDEVAALAIAAELSARDLYDAAIAGGDDSVTIRNLREQHSAYAERIAGETGISASLRATDLFDAYSADFTGSSPLNAAYRLENQLAATHADLAGLVSDLAVAEIFAAIAVIESRHAAYLATRTGRSENLDAVFRNDSASLAAGVPA